LLTLPPDDELDVDELPEDDEPDVDDGKPVLEDDELVDDDALLAVDEELVADDDELAPYGGELLLVVDELVEDDGALLSGEDEDEPAVALVARTEDGKALDPTAQADVVRETLIDPRDDVLVGSETLDGT
jgi:hypothetical protein